MNMAIGFGTTEQEFEASEEAAFTDFVTAAYREERVGYFTEEITASATSWLKERARSYSEAAELYKSTIDYPARYSYYWPHLLADASYIIVVVRFHHINRRHGLSPDGWGLLVSERIFKVYSIDIDDATASSSEDSDDR